MSINTCLNVCLAISVDLVGEFSANAVLDFEVKKKINYAKAII